jgi:hypothetical protein
MVAAATLVGSSVRVAQAEPLPSFSLGGIFGALGGTGADASHVGVGTQLGGYAAWQPMTTDQTIGIALRWSTVFGYLFDSDAALIDDRLRTVQMDFTLGARVKPGRPGRYLTARTGVELLRVNEPVPPTNQRAYVGPIASVGLDQYAFGAALFSVDVRYAPGINMPSSISLTFGFGVSL